MPENLKNNFLYDKIIKKFETNNNWVGAFIGATGSGKSWGALKLAHDLSRAQGFEFNANQVAFTAREFYEVVERRINEELPAGSIIVLDEAAILLDSDKPRSTDEIMGVKHVIESFRKYRLGLIFTIPGGFAFMQKKIRQMTDCSFIMEGINYNNGYSVCRVHWLQTNEYSGKIYTHSVKDKDGVELGVLKIYRPPLALTNAYEERKNVFAKKVLQDNLLKAKEKEQSATLEFRGLQGFYASVLKEPELYLNQTKKRFSFYLVMSRLGLPELKAKALTAQLNSDWFNGKIDLKP